VTGPLAGTSQLETQGFASVQLQDLTPTSGSYPEPLKPELVAVASFPLWPAANGAVLRCTHLLRELSSRWSVRLVAPDPSESGFDPSRFGISRFVPVSLEGRWTYFPAQYDTRPLLKAVQAEVDRAPAAAALLFSGSEFLAKEVVGCPPAVADRIDCMTLTGWRHLRRARSVREGLSLLHDLSLMARYEREVAHTPYATVVVGEDDRRFLDRLLGARDISVIPNGVDVGPDPGPASEAPAPTVVFSGVMDYTPNVDAVEFFSSRVWPRVKAAVPHAVFRIAGRSPSLRVRALEAEDGVEVTGEVPDMHPELARGWVAVAPLRIGSGVRNKVLEAWAAGTPVVLTSRATNGLPGTERFRDLIRDTPEEMAQVVIRLLTDARERTRLGRAAYREACRQSWQAVGKRVHGLLSEAAAQHLGEEGPELGYSTH